MQSDEQRTTFAITLAAFSIVGNVLTPGFCFLIFNLSGKPDEDTNALAVSITTIEIFLVVVALGGFWMLRNHVAETARSETRNFLKDQRAPLMSRAEAEARKTAEAVALRVVSDRNGATPSAPDTTEQTAAFDRE